MRKRIVVVLVAALMMSLTMALSGVSGIAGAKITTTTVACTNNAGNTVQGQLPCNPNNSLENEEEAQNPSGAAPPGHNK
jgi:hypothetical protein